MDNSLNKNVSRRGFGIIEILVSIVVLGFLMVALFNLQGGNRDAFLRIRARDAAVTVAQDAIDSLGKVGLASLSETALPSQEIKFSKIKSWERTGADSVNVKYQVDIQVSNDALYSSQEKSAYDSLDHVYAKRLDVKVTWPFKGTDHSINFSGVVR